jgi:hypothetical protein
MFVRKARRAAPASLVVAALLLWADPPAEARCGPPVVRVEPVQGPPGAAVTVKGQRIYVRCNDVGPLPPGVPVMEPAQEFQIDVTK